MNLSDTEITARNSGNPPLISDFDAGSLRRASYDLRVGAEYFVSEAIQTSPLGGSVRTQYLNPQQTFEIPPNSICYIRCKEKITIPSDVSAKVSLRMSYIYQGMMLAAQPPFDPGYDGFVIVMLHNLSSRVVPLKEGDRLVTIEFTLVHGTPTVTTTSRNVTDLQSTLKGTVTTSLQHLHGEVSKSVQRVDSFFNQLTGLIAVLIAIPTIAVVIQQNILSDRIAEQKERIQQQAAELESLKEKVQRQTYELEKFKSASQPNTQKRK